MPINYLPVSEKNPCQWHAWLRKNVFIPVDIVFYFFRIDVFSCFRHDDVLFPACDIEPAFFIQKTQVSGVEPAVLKDFRSDVGPIVITKHDIWSLENDFTDSILIRLEDPYFSH